ADVLEDVEVALVVQPGAAQLSRAKTARAWGPEAAPLNDDSELLIDPEDLDLDELDDEEVRFLRADRRVPVRRGQPPARVVSPLKIAGVILAVLVAGVVAGMWASDY